MSDHGRYTTYCKGCRCDDCRKAKSIYAANYREATSGVETFQRLFRPRPDWFDRAACSGLDPDWFHPLNGSNWQIRQAKSICERCPVREQCLEHFIDEPLGIFGGLTSTERVKLRRARRAAA